MLTHPTLDKLQRLKFTGMARALAEQMTMPDIAELDFEERLGLLIDRELTERENRRLSNRLRRARLKHNAALEDIDYRHPRGLDKSLMRALSACRWVAEHLNILITGPTGVGKTWLACALAQKACREGYSALYLRLPRLLQEMAIAKGDGRYPKLLLTLAKTEVLILDDWGLAKLTAEHRRDLLEILEERHGSASTLATSQLPIDQWHDTIGDPTLADAILDRLIHNAYRIELRGESMRKQAPKHPNDAPSSDPSSVTA
jgi:DNA replication protein DnaC